MNYTLAYRGRSELVSAGRWGVLRFAPNLTRDPVAFDAALRHPLRFREAISALHDVVVSDLRFKPRDQSAYQAWKRQQEQELAQRYRAQYAAAKAEVLGRRGQVPPDLERRYGRLLKTYWSARQAYADLLRRTDQELWRMLMPCDPVITVSPDVVFFECFSADESSYGCLTVDRRDGFVPSDLVQCGTTNVDYSWELYGQFQQLRSYRSTRLKVDPAGFEAATGSGPVYREEKIDLPPGWLRGFAQLQAAMSLPMRRVVLSRDAVYSLLAWLRRHKAKTSPRAIRFELLPDRPPALVLEPWERRITSHGTTYWGGSDEPVRIWGRQRLLVLARLLPLAESFEVYLLGTGLPSFWVARLGEMYFTLGLSGWTTNDWTRGSALDSLLPPVEPRSALVSQVAQAVRSRQSADLLQVAAQCRAKRGDCAAALLRLAHAGQVIRDLKGGVFRWRQIMPQALGEAQLGPENPELADSRQIVQSRGVQVASLQTAPGGGQLVQGTADKHPVELLLDGDGRIHRGKCSCSHHWKAGLRRGACRHLLALRLVLWQQQRAAAPETASWYDRLMRWAEPPTN
jgi:hypothetical protein